MRRFISAVLLILVLCLSGCGTDQQENKKDPSQAPTEPVTAVPSVEPTATPTPTAEPTSTPTPTPTPTAEPTPDPYSINEIRELPEFNFPEFYTQTEERPLLVVLMDYNNSLTVYDEALEKAWSEYIFGSGSIEDGTATVNDYFKEVSGGKFFFTPVLLPGNTTGVYTFHLDKDYSDEQFVHKEYSFFDYDYDFAFCMSELEANGLNTDDFAFDEINSENYINILMDDWFVGANERLKEHYIGPTILVVYPAVNSESVLYAPISKNFDKYCNVAHVTEESTFGVICHELTHLLGAYDIYNYGYYYNDLMSVSNLKTEEEYNVTHINPYYNLLYGWCDATEYTGEGTYCLDALSTGKYRPLLIPTDDPNQYFIIEARDGEGFDATLADPVTFYDVSDDENWDNMVFYEERNRVGITIWRVDQTVMNVRTTQMDKRKGVSMEGILITGKEAELMYYSDYKDPEAKELKPLGLTVAVRKDLGNGSWEIEIR